MIHTAHRYSHISDIDDICQDYQRKRSDFYAARYEKIDEENGKQEERNIDRKNQTLFPALLAQFASLSEIKRGKPPDEGDITRGSIIRIGSVAFEEITTAEV